MNSSERRHCEDDYIAISAVQHYLFCPRQCGLIHLEQVWQENRLTAEGRLLHERVHETGSESRGDTLTVRGLRISSARYGISGIADSVEFHRTDGDALDCTTVLPRLQGGWSVYPVEYKRGKPKADNTDAVQLCAQALCLEEMLAVTISTGALYYGKNHSRSEVRFTPSLRNQTIGLIDKIHEMFANCFLPAAVFGDKCRQCSLAGQCLPQLSTKNNVGGYLRRSVKKALKEDTG